MPRQFGSIFHHQVGSLFANRAELSAAGVHRPPQAGISGSKADGAVLKRRFPKLAPITSAIWGAWLL
jgi:hypothetical protein